MMDDSIYTIPQRFGLRAILLVTAVLAMVFAVTKAVEAELRVVAPVLSFVLLVGLAQMLFGKVPRAASVLGGAIVFPVSALVDPMFGGEMRLQPVSVVDLFWLITCGSLAGYIGGVLLAGIFLVADFWQQERRQEIYSVPLQFGLSTILIATTVFAVMFAVMDYARARPWQLFFFASFVATVAVGSITFLTSAYLERRILWFRS